MPQQSANPTDSSAAKTAYVPSYINSTYIGATEIESPTIYAGEFYASSNGGTYLKIQSDGMYLYRPKTSSSGYWQGNITIGRNSSSIPMLVISHEEGGIELAPQNDVLVLSCFGEDDPRDVFGNAATPGQIYFKIEG